MKVKRSDQLICLQQEAGATRCGRGEKEKSKIDWGLSMKHGGNILQRFRVSVSRIAIRDVLANREAYPLLSIVLNQFFPPPPRFSVC